MSPFVERWLSLSPNLRGILWVALSGLVFALLNVFTLIPAKHLNPYVMSFLRYLFGALFLLPVAKGYFKQEKLDVAVDAGNGSGGAVLRVASGAYDLGFAEEVLLDTDRLFSAIIRHADFQKKMATPEFHWLLGKHMDEKRAAQLATVLSEGRWTHDFPITVQAARELGMKISTDMPREVYELMDLYPQGGGVRPSVLYVPWRRPDPGKGDGSGMQSAPPAAPN